MREILFKAKRLDNGEWIEGDLMQHEESGRCIIGGIFAIGKCGYIDTDIHEVDPETVCQFTGLTDKNGKRIYENDITKDYFGNRNIVSFSPWKTGICYGLEVIGNIYDKEEPNNEN